jgi:hypothetical protein
MNIPISHYAPYVIFAILLYAFMYYAVFTTQSDRWRNSYDDTVLFKFAAFFVSMTCTAILYVNDITITW